MSVGITTNEQFKQIIREIRGALKDSAKTKSELDKINAQVNQLKLKAKEIKKQYSNKKRTLKRFASLYSDQTSKVVIVGSKDCIVWGLDQKEIESINAIIMGTLPTD